MATTTGVRLTKAGEALLAKVHTGNDKLEITNFVLGDAVWTAEEIEAGERTSLKNARVTAPVAQITTGTGVDAGRLIAAGVIDNTYITEAFYVREIGLMANDPELGEILYLIDPVAANAPTTVMESNAVHQEIPIRMELIAVSRDEVELVLSESVAYVTASRFDEAMDGIIALLAGKSDTGHKHTVSDVTDLPNSLPASDVSAWAKQPSKPTYTPNEVGAAPTSHKHKVSDITDLPASMPASDVSSWAKAASKPSYAISEITGARRKATANMTFYLRIDGSDSNDGTSAATAMKTFNALMNRIYKEWDFQGYNIYVNIGAGTWAGETWTVQGTKIVSYGGTFDIIGAGQGVTFVTGSDNITQGSGTGRAGMKISNIPLLYIQALTAINCKAQDLLLTNCSVSKISIELGYSWYDRVLSATEYHHGLQLFNTMANNSIEVKLTGTQYKSSLFSLHNSEVSKIVITGDAVFDVTNHLFISSSIDGTMDVDAASFAGFTGSVTGRKYILYVGSVLRGASYITPGTVAGYADASCIVV